MAFNRKGALEKISALLATAAEDSGASEGERLNAMAMAQRLMNKHRIEEHELAKAEGRRLAPGVVMVRPGDFKQGRLWVVDVMEAVAGPMTVDVVNQRYVGGNQPMLVGREESVAYVLLVTNWIEPQLIRMCEVALNRERTGCKNAGVPWSWGDTIRFKRSFYLGATYRLRDRLAVEAERGEVGSDVVLSERKGIDDYYADAGIRTKMTSITHAPTYDDAVSAGQRAGDAVDIDPRNKVAAATPRTQIGA